MGRFTWILIIGLSSSFSGCKPKPGEDGNEQGSQPGVSTDKHRELMKKRTEVYRELTSKQRALATLQHEIRKLEERKEKDIENEIEKPDVKFEEPRREAPVSKGSVAEANDYVKSLKEISEILEKEYEFWKRVSRQSMAGLSLGNLALLDGSTISDVKVVSINDEGITVSHSGGQSTVKMDQLPEEIRARIVDESFTATF